MSSYIREITKSCKNGSYIQPEHGFTCILRHQEIYYEFNYPGQESALCFDILEQLLRGYLEIDLPRKPMWKLINILNNQEISENDIIENFGIFYVCSI
jgi:hypothetical protein